MQQRSNLQLAQNPENEHACTVRQRISPVRTVFVKSALLELHSRFFNLLGAVIAWVHAAADYYAAAAMYEDSSRLSGFQNSHDAGSHATLLRGM